MSGKPCPHALAFIQMFPDVDMATFVHEYYSVERFRAAYNGSIPHMTDKSQWPQVDLGFKLLPPPLKEPVVDKGKTSTRLLMNQEQRNNNGAPNVVDLDIVQLRIAL